MSMLNSPVVKRHSKPGIFYIVSHAMHGEWQNDTSTTYPTQEYADRTKVRLAKRCPIVRQWRVLTMQEVKVVDSQTGIERIVKQVIPSRQSKLVIK